MQAHAHHHIPQFPHCSSTAWWEGNHSVTEAHRTLGSDVSVVARRDGLEVALPTGCTTLISASLGIPATIPHTFLLLVR